MVATPRQAEAVALLQEAEAVLPLGVVRPPQGAEEGPPPAQERPEGREIGMGTVRDKADRADRMDSVDTQGTVKTEGTAVKT